MARAVIDCTGADVTAEARRGSARPPLDDADPEMAFGRLTREGEVAVTDDQLETLRAQLAGRTAEHLRMLDRLDPVEVKTAYATLIGAAFFEAAERRFIRNGKYVPDSEVLDFVAAVRSLNEEAAETLDPETSERILLAALDKGEVDDLDDDVVLGTEIFLLGAVIADEQLSTRRSRIDRGLRLDRTPARR